MNKLLEVNDLRVSFPSLRGNKEILLQAVRGVSFSLSKGKVLGIVGESGSGKSVSTSAIPGLLPDYAQISGEILYEGKNLLELSKKELRFFRGKKIGMIFQEPARSFDPLQSMGSVFYETLRNENPAITKDEAKTKAINLLQEVGLSQVEQRLQNFPHQFSGGQLQRIGIALALAQGCQLLIADEPTTALDVTIQSQLMALLKRLQKSRGLSIIFISHNIDLVAGISDRVMVMYGGLVMEENSVENIMNNPQHPYTKALLQASPHFGMHYSCGNLPFIPGKVVDPTADVPGCPFCPRCELAQGLCAREIPSLAEFCGARLRCHVVQSQEKNGGAI